MYFFMNIYNKKVKRIRFILICVLFFYANLCVAKDQRYNPTSDFLFHEAGGVVTNNNKNNFDANFPSLPSPKSTQPPQTQLSGKRDYVAPQHVTTKPTSASKSDINAFTPTGSTSKSPKRDYVAPQFPTLKPIGTSQKHTNSITTPLSSPSSKRDYVAPKLPSVNNENTQLGSGKVKDLINFYDKNAQAGFVPSNKPSYSNILQGPKNNEKPNQSTGNIQHGIQSTSTTIHTPKPMTFSSVVSGANKPSTVSTIATSTPPKRPSTSISNVTPTNRPSTPTNRPGTPTNRPPTVLPSSITSSQGQLNSNTLSDAELQTVSEELLRKDINNAAKYVTINYQEKTTSFSKDDKSPLPLLTISPEVWNIPTIQIFLPLLDNYERDTLVNEYVTSQERNEENAFMDAIMATSVIRHLMNVLKDKGYVTPDPKQQRDYLKQMWFGLYSRGKGKISSSGFEHIFVSELKNGEVSGLHNWLYYSKEEVANRINYLGYLKYVELNEKGAVIKMHFNQQGVDKPVDTLFIGTSPELEIAIYTLCYVTRVDKDCKLKLGAKDVDIVTHNFRYRSKNYIGSAYPQI